jgi:hypothetical protein
LNSYILFLYIKRLSYYKCTAAAPLPHVCGEPRSVTRA